MKLFVVATIFLGALSAITIVSGFIAPSAPSFLHRSSNERNIKLRMTNQQSSEVGPPVDRRSIFSRTGKVAVVVAGSFFSAAPQPPPVIAAEGSKKIVVMGGAGYVGSRVSAALSNQGYDVVVVSRSSASDQASKIKGNVGKSIPNIQYVSLDATTDDLEPVMKGASVVVSCVGIPPWEKSTARAGNGVANSRIAEAAKAAGVPKYVYVSVAKEFSNSPAKFLFGEYFTGKAEAEAAATKNFGKDNVVFIKPGFIDGSPPGEVRPPGPPGLPAISPDAVANAAVAAALGQVSGSLDGYDAIMTAAK